jgi:hypothetical protein
MIGRHVFLYWFLPACLTKRRPIAKGRCIWISGEGLTVAWSQSATRSHQISAKATLIELCIVHRCLEQIEREHFGGFAKNETEGSDAQPKRATGYGRNCDIAAAGVNRNIRGQSGAGGCLLGRPAQPRRLYRPCKLTLWDGLKKVGLHLVSSARTKHSPVG